MVAAINRAMDDDTVIEADRPVHPLRFEERRALNGRVWRVGSRRKVRGCSVDMKLAVPASLRGRRHRHARLLVPLVNFLAISRHGFSRFPAYWDSPTTGFLCHW